MLGRHRHRSRTGYTLEGSWQYLVRLGGREQGNLVRESPGRTHTLYSEAGMKTSWLNGPLEFLDEHDRVTETVDVFWFIDHYERYCVEKGLPINERLSSLSLKEPPATTDDDSSGEWPVAPATTAEHLLLLLAAYGVEHLFLNPGTDSAPIQEAAFALGEAGANIPAVGRIDFRKRRFVGSARLLRGDRAPSMRSFTSTRGPRTSAP